MVADGKQAFIDYFEEMSKDYPDKKIEFVRAVAEGDLVALHTHQTWPGNEKWQHYVLNKHITSTCSRTRQSRAAHASVLFPGMYRNQGEKWMKQFKEFVEKQ